MHPGVRSKASIDSWPSIGAYFNNYIPDTTAREERNWIDVNLHDFEALVDREWLSAFIRILKVSATAKVCFLWRARIILFKAISLVQVISTKPE